MMTRRASTQARSVEACKFPIRSKADAYHPLIIIKLSFAQGDPAFRKGPVTGVIGLVRFAFMYRLSLKNSGSLDTLRFTIGIWL